MGSYITKCCQFIFCLKPKIQTNYQDADDTSYDYRLIDIDGNDRVDTLDDVKIRTSDIIKKRIGDPNDVYYDWKEIGEGSFGKVFRVTHRQTGALRVIKKIERTMIHNVPQNNAINLEKAETNDIIIPIDLNLNKNDNEKEIYANSDSDDLKEEEEDKDKVYDIGVNTDNHLNLNYSKSKSYSSSLLNSPVKRTNSNAYNLPYSIQNVNDIELEKEINVLRSLNHPNIVKVYEYFSDSSYIYITFEYCKMGDLFDQINLLAYNEVLVEILMTQIFSAVSYLHSKNIIHADLKLENILIEITTTRNFKDIKGIRDDYFNNIPPFEVKLIDFGSSKIHQMGLKGKVHGIIGTAIYNSPEVIRNNYDEKCDMWSCGIIMYYLLFGYPPFEGETIEEIYDKTLNDPIVIPKDHNISKSAVDLIKALLVKDPTRRISATQVLKHNFFNKSFAVSRSRSNLNAGGLSNIKSRKSGSKFHQAIIAYITHNFADYQEVTNLRNLFRYLDKDGNGTLSKDEILEGFKEFDFDINGETLNEVINNMDNDANGYIEYEEFLRAGLDIKHLLTDQNMKLAFELFDSDNSGEISIDEMKKVIFGDMNVSMFLVHDFMDEIGKHVDDLISYEDFKNIIQDEYKDIFKQDENHLGMSGIEIIKSISEEYEIKDKNNNNNKKDSYFLDNSEKKNMPVMKLKSKILDS